MTRVVILGNPTKALGSVAEPECRRIVAAIDLGSGPVDQPGPRPEPAGQK
jgi:hypothetical protein